MAYLDFATDFATDERYASERVVGELHKWLEPKVRLAILHYMEVPLWSHAPPCSCGIHARLIIYTTVDRLLQYGYIVLPRRTVMHYFYCELCQKPVSLYVHPVVAGLEIVDCPLDCPTYPLTESPAWR